MTDDPDESTIRVGRRNQDHHADLDESTIRVGRRNQRDGAAPPIAWPSPDGDAALPPGTPARSPSIREITPHAPDFGVISRAPGDLGTSADAAPAAARGGDVDGVAIERAVRRIALVRALTVLGIAVAVVAASVVLLVLLLA